MLTTSIFAEKELKERLILTNQIAENAQNLMSSLEMAGLLMAAVKPIRTNIVVAATNDVGYKRTNLDFGSLYHLLVFENILINGTNISPTTDNHFKFTCGRPGRYRISLNVFVEWQPTVVDAGEVAKDYYTNVAIALTNLKLTTLKNGAAHITDLYGLIRSYSTTNSVYNYFAETTINGSYDIELLASDYLEFYIPLKNVGAVSLVMAKIFGHISIDWIDNFGNL